MAKSVTTIGIKLVNQTGLGVAARSLADATLPGQGISGLINLLNAVNGGSIAGLVEAYVEDDDGTAAGEDVTCDESASANGDTLTVAGIVFTVVGAGLSTADGDIETGATDTTFGDNLVTALAAHPKTRSLVSGSNAAGTVTVTAKVGGVIGNLISLAETGGGFAVGAALLSGGAVGTVTGELRAYSRGER